MVKGRSSNRRMNRKCKRHMAICQGGRLSPFRFYVPSARNPADRPSRRRTWPSRLRPSCFERPQFVVLHLFAGVARANDLFDWLHRLA
eukprot:11189816-Lingulodinium_polyedra.AAC.1